jgi:hypothetical protein
MPGMIVAVFNKLADPVKLSHNLDPHQFMVTLRRYLTNANSRIKLKAKPKTKKTRQLQGGANNDDNDVENCEARIANEKY